MNHAEWAVYSPESPLKRYGKLAASMIADLARARYLAWRLAEREIDLPRPLVPHRWKVEALPPAPPVRATLR